MATLQNSTLRRSVVLVVGPGRCGLRSIAAVLNQQPETNITVEEPPLLPWEVADPGTKIRARLERIATSRKEAVIGDAAGFYLPYLEKALEANPTLKIVAMQRPREEVVASWSRFLDEANAHPTDHWASEPTGDWQAHPLWSRTFPNYDAGGRSTNISCYWDEYDRQCVAVAERYPDRVLLCDMHRTLNTESGQKALLEYVGYPAATHRLIPNIRESRTPERPMGRGRCVILVPFGGSIHPGCERSLQELERRGYLVRRVSGYAAIDQARNQMATDALLDGFDETMWIDSDVEFDPDSVDHLRSRSEAICCGTYPQKGRRAIASHALPGTKQLTFGVGGGIEEILYAPGGFLRVRREVYLTILSQLKLPVLNEQFGSPMIPFFQPMTKPDADGEWYLAEDFAFCERARLCGYRIFTDTTIRLWHVGSYRYGWEDSGREMERNVTFTLHLNDD